MSERERVDATGASQLNVDAADAEVRVDVYLARQLGVSRREVQRLITGGKVDLNGAPVRTKGALLRAGDVLRVEPFTPTEAMEIIPEPARPLRILAQTAGWLIVDKPAGMPVHPLNAGETGTVLNTVAARWPQVQGVGEGGLRSGVVHRLDVDTSGTLAVATEESTWRRLRTAFENHQTVKRYRAIVHGRLDGQQGQTMDLCITRHRPAKVSVIGHDTLPAPAGTRRCTLSWKSLAAHDQATLVEIHLDTGFLHQVRVMMAHLGHPLVGDTVYDDAISTRRLAAPRHMLHASFLRIEDMEATSPDPADFAAVLAEVQRAVSSGPRCGWSGSSASSARRARPYNR